MASAKMYTLQEVARLLRISERSMYRYIKDGKMKAVKIGYWRINEQDLKNFMRKHSNQ